MKYLALFVFFLTLSFFSSCSSSKIDFYEEKIQGTWYPDRTGFGGRIQFMENYALYERQEPTFEVTENTPQQVIDRMGKWEVRDSIKIVEKIRKGKSSLVLILKEMGKDIGYNAFLIENTSNKDIKTIVIPSKKGFKTATEAKEALQNFKFKHIKHKIILSESFVNNIENLKPAYEITRKDFIKVLKKLNASKDDLEKYAESQAGANSGKIGQELFRKELFLMGYNPYLERNADGKEYFERFKDDIEIQKLMDNEKIGER